MRFPLDGELASFDDIDRLADQFEAILKQYGIQIRSGTPLERGLLQLYELRRRRRENDYSTVSPALAADLQEAVGVVHLIRLVVRASGHPQFNILVPHLNLLNEGEVAQTRGAPAVDQASNKLVELYVALAALESATEISVDPPDGQPRESNPDVLARMKDGRLWGFACKAIHGDAPMTLFENLVKGVGQIQASKKADTGIVIVTFKDRIPHGRFFPTLSVDETGTPILGAHRDVNDAVEGLAAFAKGRITAMIDWVTKEKVWEELRGKKALPGLLTVMTTGVGLLTPRGPLPSFLGFLQLEPLELSPIWYPSEFNYTVKKTLEQLNHGFRASA